eukprot:gene22616-biopygen1191
MGDGLMGVQPLGVAQGPPHTPGQATRSQRWSGRRGCGAAVSKGEWRAPQAPPSAKVNGGRRRLRQCRTIVG